jgi:hypothetical protein
LGGESLGVPYLLFAVFIFDCEKYMSMGINEVNLDNLSLARAEEFIGEFCSKTVMGCRIGCKSTYTDHGQAMNEYPHDYLLIFVFFSKLALKYRVGNCNY